MQPKVTLVNFTPDPMETVWILWEASKVDGPVSLSVEEVKRTVPRDKLQKLFWDVLRQNIPVGEHLDFIFMMEGVSVSWREQAVRHRIGTHVGDRVGVDIIPDLADSTWWSQSMRIQDMGKFADTGMYRVPETLDGKELFDGTTAMGLFHDTMKQIQGAYKTLVAAGVPMEDARELIPLGAQHRISWKVNLSSLIHILAKRGCWILQLGIWGPVILGMVDELVKKVDPMFARIVSPPCIDADDKFNSCTYRLENARRMDGSDAHAPCPMYLCRDDSGTGELRDSAVKVGVDLEGKNKFARKAALISADNLVPRHHEMKERAQEYRRLWQHDPYIWVEE